MTLSAAYSSALYLSQYRYTGKQRDAESGLDFFEARYFGGGNNLGRFMTPDPLPWLEWQLGEEEDRQKFAAWIANPQSLNRYAYASNNPTTLTDPSGLSDCGGNPNLPCNNPSAMQNCTLDGAPTDCGMVNDIYGSGAACIGSCTLTVNGTNGLPYQIVQTAGTSDIYAVFAAMCLNQNCDPFAPQNIGYQFAKGVYNVTWAHHTLNTANLAGYWKDPSTFLHNGYPSWFQGSPLDMLDVVHLIGSATLEGHEDPFGPLNPLHYLIQFPQMIVPAGGRYNATCSLVGGCVIGH